MFAKLTLNLTRLGKIARENPNLVFKKKNGEQIATVVVNTRKSPDQYGNDLNVTLKPKDEPFDNKWYVGDGKEYKSTPAPTAPQDVTVAQALQQNPAPADDPLPF